MYPRLHLVGLCVASAAILLLVLRSGSDYSRFAVQQPLRGVIKEPIIVAASLPLRRVPQFEGQQAAPSTGAASPLQAGSLGASHFDRIVLPQVPMLLLAGALTISALVWRTLNSWTRVPKDQEFCMLATSGDNAQELSRRAFLAAPMVTSAWMMAAPAALARLPNPPEGYLRYRTIFENYDFVYPADWFRITGSGDTVLFRSSFNPEVGLFINISSPTASKYTDVESLGSPDKVAQDLVETLLLELMSTRLGVRRESQIVSATSRKGTFDDKTYYDIDIRIQSYAGTNQMAERPDQRPVVLEWDRHYITTLGVANNRLYELRLEVPQSEYELQRNVVSTIQRSFRPFEAK